MRLVRIELVGSDERPLTETVALRVLSSEGAAVEEHQLTDVRGGASLFLDGEAVVRSVTVLDLGGSALPVSGPPVSEMATAAHIRLTVSPVVAAPATARPVRALVSDDLGRPVGGAELTVVATGVAVTTSEDGVATLLLPRQPVEILVRLFDSATSASVDEAADAVEVVLDGLEPVPPSEVVSPPRLPSPDGYVESSLFSDDVPDVGNAFLSADRSVEESTSLVVVRLEEPALAAGLPAPALTGATAMKPVDGAADTRSATTPPMIAKLDTDVDQLDDVPAATRGKADWLRDLLQPPPQRVEGLRPLPARVEHVLRSADAEDRDHLYELMAEMVGSTARRRVLPTDPIRWHVPGDRREASTVARGHLVRFRQLWRADGYSFGRLLHSLPLAPGQAKRIAVVDWRREESGQQSSVASAREELTAEIDRSRTLSEDMSSVLSERLKGQSESFSLGAGAGVGAGATGTMNNIGFSVLGGAAGGIGYATAKADQSSMKSLTAAMQQEVRDRTAQAARSVREQRTTVIRTVSQSERSTAVTEVVANHNRNHAMTVLYFEVLRHLVVTTELADVTPCLLVPLPTVAFTPLSALQHQDVLAPLVPSALQEGFAACERLLAPAQVPDRTLRDLRLAFELVATAPEAPDAEPDEDVEQQRPHDPPYASARVRLLGRDGAGAWLDTAVLVDGGGTATWRYEASVVAAADRAADTVTAVEIELGERPGDDDRSVALHDLEITAVVGSTPHVLSRTGGRLPLRMSRVRVAARPAPAPPDDERDRLEALRLVQHLNAHRIRFHKAIWSRFDRDELFAMLDERIAPGASRSLASIVRPDPVGFIGNSLVLPFVDGVTLSPGDEDVAALQRRYWTPPIDQRVTLPTGGVFAEAVLGSSRAAEVIDDTRFWKWDEHPLDVAPDLAPVSTDSRQSGMDLTAPTLPAALVGMQQAGSLPDPQSITAGLAAIAAGTTFRDVTGIDKVTQNSIDALRQAVQSAQSLGEHAGENATKAFVAHTEAQTERYRAEATQRNLASLDEARRNGLVTPEQASRIAERILTPGANDADGSNAGGDGSTASGGDSGSDSGAGSESSSTASTPSTGRAQTSTHRSRPSTPPTPAGSAGDVPGVERATYVGSARTVTAKVRILAGPTPDEIDELIGTVSFAMQVVRSPDGVVFPLTTSMRPSIGSPWNRVLSVGTTWTSRSVQQRADGHLTNRLLSQIQLDLTYSATERTNTSGLSSGVSAWEFAHLSSTYEHAISRVEQPRGSVHAELEVVAVNGTLVPRWTNWTHIHPGNRIEIAVAELPRGVDRNAGDYGILTLHSSSPAS